MSQHAHTVRPPPLSDPPGLVSAEPPASMLVRLAEQAASCVPPSCGAATTLSVDGVVSLDTEGETEPSAGVTHPDLAPLLAVQWEAGEGPIPNAIRTGEPVESDDLLADGRWPAYRSLALNAGVRSTTTLPFRRDSLTVTVTVCGFRPGLMDDRTRTATTLLGDLATHTLDRDRRYEQALIEAEQLHTALRTRPVVDQACGIIMHILGCDADTAFELLRRQSQRTNSKLLTLAHELIRTRGRALDTGAKATAAG